MQDLQIIFFMYLNVAHILTFIKKLETLQSREIVLVKYGYPISFW